MMKIDVRNAVYGLRREFKSLTGSEFNRAVARTINRTATQARTQANKSIREKYNAKAGDVRKALIIQRASQNNLSGFVIAAGRRLPLMSFSPRQTRRGVSVNIMGTRKVVRGAFIATMKSGHRGVFARGAYSGGQFQFRNKRVKKKGNDLQINELYTSSVPNMMMQNEVLSALKDTIERTFPDRLRHELSFILSKKTGGPV